MNIYSIFCTEEQIKKALKLGAPIETYKPIIINSKAGGSFTTPTIETVTAEQMIGWLEQNPRISDFDIYRSGSTYWAFFVTKFCGLIKSKKKYFSRKEATLAAIDEALDFLVKAKEEKP